MIIFVYACSYYYIIYLFGGMNNKQYRRLTNKNLKKIVLIKKYELCHIIYAASAYFN